MPICYVYQLSVTRAACVSHVQVADGVDKAFPIPTMFLLSLRMDPRVEEVLT